MVRSPTPLNHNSCSSINLYWAQIKFPMQKLAIFRKVKEIKELRVPPQGGNK